MSNILSSINDQDRAGLLAKTAAVILSAQACTKPTAVEADERAFATVWGEWVRYLQTTFGDDQAARASMSLLNAMRDQAAPRVVLQAQRRAAKFIRQAKKK